MKQETPPSAPVLSLQNKLDHIAHERAVLAVMRTLAQRGMREGDRVVHSASGLSGRVLITRDEAAPEAVVLTDSGNRETFDAALWSRR